MPENSHPEDNYTDPSKPFAAPKALGEKDSPQSSDSHDDIERESLSIGGKLAWLVVAVVVVLMIASTALFRSGEEARTEANSSDLFPVQLQGRTVVGQKRFLGGMGSSSSDDDEVKTAESDEDDDNNGDEKKPSASGPTVPEQLNDGTYEQRLCYVILVAESNGPDEAAKKLSELDEAATEADFELNEDQAKLREIVGKLIESQQDGDFDATPLSGSERDLIKEKLGWIGEIALVPEGTRNVETRKQLLSEASWSMGLMMTFMFLMLFTLMVGVALAAVFSVLFATSKLKPKFLTHGKSVNIYIETFALWLVFFFGGPELMALGMGMAQIEMTPTLSMIVSMGFFFGSLIVLVYPMIRGISFRQMCKDIGWKAKGGLVDVAVSPVNYIAGTPLMVLGLICVLILTLVAGLLAEPKPFGTGIAAGHPIQNILAEGQWLNITYVIMMACVAAPIVEETMFRGVLYRHLRELSGTWSRWGSVIFSALFNGLIFAAIHPQGYVAIPLLTALAINFSLVREWRDSLIAPIIMHGINNGSVTLFMLLMMS